MSKYWQHFKTITLHKYFVMIECFKLGLIWQGITHDLSKYSFIEFFTSARYFQGDKTPIGVEKALNGYSIAWLNHKAKNKHHWEYWTDFRFGEIITIPIPDKYIKEMFCDMIGASKAYNKDKFHRMEPYNYFKRSSSKWYMDADSKRKLEMMLYIYGGKGDMR